MANAHAPGVPSPDAGRSASTPAGRRVGTRVTVRIALEALGVLIVVAFALIAVAHLLQTQRAPVLLSDGDSVILPIMLRSFTEGEPQLWAMSAVLFAFPEIPLYLLSAAIGHTPQLAFIVNAAVNVLAAYGALRLLIRFVAPKLAPTLRIAAGIVPIGWLVLLVSLEHTALRDSFELASLFLTTTYYSGSTLGLLVTIALLTGIVGRRDTRAIGLLVALGVLTALCMSSNPLHVVWSVAPAIGTVLILSSVRRAPWRTSLVVIGVLAAGTVVGLALRIPFARNISTGLQGYIRPDGWLVSSEYYGARLGDTTTSASGVIEIILVILAALVTIVVAVLAISRRWDRRTTTALVAAALTIATTFLAMMTLGTEAARYFAPVWFGAVAAIAVGSAHAAGRLQGWWRTRGVRQAAGTASNGRRSTVRTAALAVAAVLVIGTLVGGGAAMRSIAADPDVQRFDGAACVSEWVDGRDITGAGQFWTIRGLQAYGGPDVRLLQIDASFHPYLWITNAADFTGQDVSYLVVDDQSAWYHPLEQDLGEPASRMSCGGFTILDYGGTPGEAKLTTLIGDSARQQRAERGLEH
ncbi:hypothetical protein [Plantibacter sp. YIM 135347]|uniref:hypothetical protein n=1 Tax=Plantibacter sp. YIM 135347 TaxID=3423919 RepID=UPI003D335209